MAEPDEEFISFEKALRDLEMKSEQLKKLVSEGEIRAFRDGSSMKFRREDVRHLSGQDADEELFFPDDLEDDTGMVTEELTEDETLLAEDDLIEDEEEETKAPARRAPRASSARPARAAPVEEAEAEPIWVTGVAILGAVVALYGFMVMYSIATEASSDLFGLFAKV
ncbi:MAG: hypothetical protein AAF628_25785 [Planctomycetota bacterium]